jgi:hypothetical protein
MLLVPIGGEILCGLRVCVDKEKKNDYQRNKFHNEKMILISREK